MSISAEEQQDIRSKSAKPMLYLGIVSMCMIFAGLTSAYIVSSGSSTAWVAFELPTMFYVSTLVIICSSLCMLFAHRSAKNDNMSGVKIGVLMTLILGISFIFCQYKAFGELVANKLFMVSSTNSAPQYLYFIVGAHLAHLLGGIIMLIYVCIKSFKQLYHSKNLLGLQLSSIYWHFLDLLWVYLFLFMYFAH